MNEPTGRSSPSSARCGARTPATGPRSPSPRTASCSNELLDLTGVGAGHPAARHRAAGRATPPRSRPPAVPRSPASTSRRRCSRSRASGPRTAPSSRARWTRCRSPTSRFDVVTSVNGFQFALDPATRVRRGRARARARRAAGRGHVRRARAQRGHRAPPRDEGAGRRARGRRLRRPTRCPRRAGSSACSTPPACASTAQARWRSPGPTRTRTRPCVRCSRPPAAPGRAASPASGASARRSSPRSSRSGTASGAVSIHNVFRYVVGVKA